MSFYIHRNISILQRHVLVGQKLFWISTYHHKWELGKRDYSMERKAKWHLSNRQHPLDVWNSCFCGLSLLIWKRNRRSGPVKVARHLRMKFKSDLQPKLKMCLKTLHFFNQVCCITMNDASQYGQRSVKKYYTQSKGLF